MRDRELERTLLEENTINTHHDDVYQPNRVRKKSREPNSTMFRKAKILIRNNAAETCHIAGKHASLRSKTETNAPSNYYQTAAENSSS